MRKSIYILLILVSAFSFSGFKSVKAEGTLTICSFNIQFLGNSRARDDSAISLTTLRWHFP